MTKGLAGRVGRLGAPGRQAGRRRHPTPGPGYAQLPAVPPHPRPAHHGSAAKGSRELHPDTANFSSSLIVAAGTSLQGRVSSAGMSPLLNFRIQNTRISSKHPENYAGEASREGAVLRQTRHPSSALLRLGAHLY